jgi:hypothetical protein
MSSFFDVGVREYQKVEKRCSVRSRWVDLVYEDKPSSIISYSIEIEKNKKKLKNAPF